MTETPYKECENRCPRCEEAYLPCFEVIKNRYYAEGYAAALADNAPKRFDKQLPPDNIGMILLINYRSTFVVWKDYDCSAITSNKGSAGYKWCNENGDGDTYYFTHWLPFPCVSPKSIT